MKSNSNSHFQSRLFVLLVTACLLFQAGFPSPVLASSQTATSSVPQASLPIATFTTCAAVNEIPPAECAALVALYNSTDGANWSIKTNWLQTNTPCTWYGVLCTAGHVTLLGLSYNNLFGTIPAQLGNLTELTVIWLTNNPLFGNIPAQLGSLTNLTDLWLDSNQLTGSIPAQLGNLKKLNTIYLESNQLTGSIPAELGSLTSLEQLYLNNNQLTGSIPAQLGSLMNLQFIDLSGNQLTGSIPAELGNPTNLSELNLRSNQLTGSIPAQLGNLANLWELNLSGNQLTGSIPAELGNLTGLNDLDLSKNQLTGSIPAELGSMTNLQYLYLHYNQLSGEFPATFIAANLPNLIALTFDCGITSTNPAVIAFIANFAGTGWEKNTCTAFTSCAEITQIPAMECDALAALHNSTDGPNWYNNYGWLHIDAPCAWYGVTCNAGHVTELNLSGNNLFGTIPPELGNLTQLQTLSLSNSSHKSLSGSIPPELGNLEKLQILDLNYNQLTGSIPASLGNLTQLREIGLQDNQLTGSIPATLGNLTQLQTLWLGYNQLSGSIPPELGNLRQLRELGLGSNQLTGSIPPELGQLTQLQSLYLFVNHLTSNIPASLGNLTQLQLLFLSWNQLTGSIPASLGNLTQLESFLSEDNQLSGSIPPGLGSLTQLMNLDLSNNQLTGNMPPGLGNLTQLTDLDLSNNQLTGNMPPELGQLTNLYSLYVENNKLGGEIPASILNLTSLGKTSNRVAPKPSVLPQPGNAPDRLVRPDVSTHAKAHKARDGSLEYLELSCGLTSTNPAVIAFVESLSPGWLDKRCVTTIKTDTPDPSALGQAVKVTVTVGGGKVMPTGTVTISGADRDCQIALVGGAGNCLVTFNTLGAKTLTAIYNGDKTYSGSWDVDAHSVNANPEKPVVLLPVTGFSPGKVTSLAKQPNAKTFNSYSDLVLEIPSLGLKMNIVGVPLVDGKWDVSWLGRNAGYLNGTAFPTLSGNSVITGHVWNADNTPGKFAGIKNLRYGDKFTVRAFGRIFTYEVRENILVSPSSINSVLKHEDTSWITLLTCEGYTNVGDRYAYRRAVRAVLVSSVTAQEEK